MSGYGAFARYYDALTENIDYRGRAAYFDALARRHAPGLRGGLLLDLACGTGNLSFALADLGYEVIGVDASAEMLAEASRKAAEYRGKPVLFLRQSMTRLDLYGTVDITVCALDSLNHLPGERALAAAFGKVALFTAPGGLFLFDVNTAYKHREVLADNVYVYEPEGLFCVWRNACDPADGRVEIALDFFEEQSTGGYLRSAERFTERLFSHATLERLLAEKGFALQAVYGDDSFDPPGEKTQRAVYVASRL